VGYSSEVTVAVWVGNFDGKPMGNISGITGAGPLFRSVMIAAMAGRHPRDFPQPPDIESQRVCSLSGQLPGPGCVHTHEEFFLEGTAPSTPCGIHQVALVDRSTGLPAGPDTPAGDVRTVVLESYPPELLAWAEEAGRPLVPGALAASQTSTEATGPAILAPGEGAIFAIDPDVPRAHQKLEVALDVPAGATRAVLLVDGEPRGEADGPPWILDWVLEPGEHVLAARIGPDTSAPVSIWVE